MVVVGEGRIEVGKSRFLVLVVGVKEGMLWRLVRMWRVIPMKSMREIERVEGIMILDGRRGVMLDVLV